MIRWAIRKYVVGKINCLLANYRGDVDKASSVLTVWIERLEKILGCFRSVLAKLDDGKIDGDEVDQAVAEAEAVIKEW